MSQKRLERDRWYYLGCALMWCAPFPVMAQELAVTAMPLVTVEAGSDAFDPLLRADRLIEQSVGNASVVVAEEYRAEPVVSLHDALANSPGVYANNEAGQQTVRLSIRGSGLSTSFAMRGVRLLRDGLALGRADGYADTTWLDPLSAAAIEVYRGASAMSYGVSTLGGALNVISPTAYTWHGRELRFELGGDDYRHWQVRAAGVSEQGVDAYVALSEFSTEGSREHSQQKVRRFYGNLGYRHNATAESRLHLTVEQNRQQFPGALSLEQFHSNPSQAAARALRVNEGLDLWPRWNLAFHHVWEPSAGQRLLVGTYIGHTSFVNPNANLELSYKSRDYGIAVRHEWTAQLAGRPLLGHWGVNLAWSQSKNQTHGPVWLGAQLLDARNILFEDIDSHLWTHEAYGELRWELLPKLTLVGGLLATWAERDITLDVVNQAQAFPLFRGGQQDQRYSAVSPRLGVLWQVSAQAQLFANLSRSFEPPTAAEFVGANGVLQAQRATTIEVGSRGGSTSFNWEVAAYHNRTSPELLAIEFPPGSGRYSTGNIERTRRLGLESKLQGRWRLPQQWGSLDWGLAYTWSRGRISRSVGFDGKVLPSLPEHYGRVSLRYVHPNGWYAGPDWEGASSWYVDQANTLRAPGYGLWNLTAGYARPDAKGRVFVSVRNLANKAYIASTKYVVAASPEVEVFNPGQGRTWIAGMQWQW